MADDFYSFDEALDELKLKEEELKRLVSEGEIRAFRKGDTMKLRRADVENLRAELDRDVVDLGDTVDELVFEDDTDLAGDTGMATQELDVETLVDDEVEEVAELELEDIAPTSSRRASSRGGKGGGAAAAAPVRRASAASAATIEAEEEPSWVKAAAILTALVLLFTGPVIMSITSGNPGPLAKGVAGIFGQSFEAAPDAAPTSAEE